MKLLTKLVLLFPFFVIAQNKASFYEITYDMYENGVKSNASYSIKSNENTVFLSDSEDKIQYFINLKDNEYITTLNNKNVLYKNTIPYSELPKPTFDNKREEILGYSCNYAKYFYFSNTIEVWYTEEAKAKGSIYGKYLPNTNALVLKIVINGNRKIIATSIKKLKDVELPTYLPSKAKEVSKAELEEIKINARFVKLPIFIEEQINFDPGIKIPKEEELILNTSYHFSKGSIVLKKIKIPKSLQENHHVFAELTCKSKGDAYDRTGSVFIIPTNKKASILQAMLQGDVSGLPVFIDNSGNKYQGIIKTDKYDPPLEILRFFTSFGAGYFNDKREINNYKWENDIVYKQDISLLFPENVGEIWVGVYIGNYDKNGHEISLDFNFYPLDEDEKKGTHQKYVQPLFSTMTNLEMLGQNYGKLFKTDTLKVTFDTKENMENLQLVYTSTGHGGWGRGDEFNPKLNTLLIDGKEVFKIVPWRTDCATYRLSNPASGNFSNGLSSSDYSRSNWCPGTLTPPYIVPLPNLSPGSHTLELIIDQGDDEEGAFNHWSVTGTLIGNLKKE